MTRIDLIKENKITSSIIDLIKETKAISSIHEAKDFLAKLKAVDVQTYDYLHDEIIAQIDPSKVVDAAMAGGGLWFEVETSFVYTVNEYLLGKL